MTMLLGLDTAMSGIIIACVSAVVAIVTAVVSFKGKRIDAVEWLTERLREDANVAREKLKEEQAENEGYKEQLSSLRAAVVQLQHKETDLMIYISTLEDQINQLKEIISRLNGEQ